MAVALLGAMLVAGLIGAATYGSILGVRSQHYALTAAIATLAVSSLLQQVVKSAWPETVSYPASFPSTPISIGPWQISELYVAALATGVTLLVLVTAFLRWTRVGTMIRALADNSPAARLCGANVAALVAGVWGVAGALAALAGFFEAQITFDPFFLAPAFLMALIASVVGGLRSLPIAFLGAIGLEVASTLFQSYAGNVSSDLPSYAKTFLLVLLIAFLLIAPARWIGRVRGRTV
jgi:branched-chain amino acid transport system permease protein